ncbi:MAG: hypothetical protein AAFO01_08260 [Pseudomonadota bacterium]
MQPDDILEMLMLICFSTGWYWSIGFMVVTRRPCGKSEVFVLCTICGYILGLIAKLWSWQATNEMNYLVLVYCWNLSIASLDLALLSYLSSGRGLQGQNLEARPIALPVSLIDPASLVHPGPNFRRYDVVRAVRLERL